MINPQKYYSITELIEMSREGLFPIKTRQTILKLIKEKRIQAIDIGTNPKKAVYSISGESLLQFLDTRGQFKKELLSGIRKRSSGK